jgi:hypothetical protein
VSTRPTTKHRGLRASIALAAALMLSSGRSEAMFTQPSNAPVARLVENLKAYTKEHPEDPEGYYNLARVHFLAFSLKRESLDYRKADQGPPVIPADESRQGDKHESPTDAELLTHLDEGVRQFNKAISLDPKALYFLGLASLLESGRDMAPKVRAVPMADDPRRQYEPWTPEANARRNAQWIVERLGKPREPNIADVLEQARKQIRHEDHAPWGPDQSRFLAAELHKHLADPDEARRKIIQDLLILYWDEQIAECYFEAFSRALPADSHMTQKQMFGLRDVVAYEGASAFLRIVKTRAERPQDAVRIATADAAVKAFEKLPQPMIVTPIIFNLSEERPLESLVDRAARVRFDLDGFGEQSWSWVRPDTGLLAWDPKHTGVITSGRQLFGSVTWWMFFRNGYEALSALDDNRDGQLTGHELDGLAVWFDRNGNGVSDPGEVIPIDQLGIEAISCRAASMDGESPANHEGLRMTDGRLLPTYDWIAHAAPQSKTVPVLPALAALAGLSTLGSISSRRRARLNCAKETTK